MRKQLMAISALATILTGGAAQARLTDWSFGARVGGYGFREVQADGSTTWDGCRMDGSGLFAQRGLARHAFLEGGLDFYQARGETVMEEGMDRVSTQATIAGGLRMFPGRLISPYVQVGVGAEYTDVRNTTSGDHGSAMLPLGFLGFGADARVGSHLRIGANVRFHMMGAVEEGSTDFEPAAASQGQIFLRYDL